MGSMGLEVQCDGRAAEPQGVANILFGSESGQNWDLLWKEGSWIQGGSEVEGGSLLEVRTEWWLPEGR